MSNVIPETFYGGHEPQWMVESQKEGHSHFSRRGCVRQIRSTSSGFVPARTENLPSAGSSYPLRKLPMTTVDHHHAYTYSDTPTMRLSVDRTPLSNTFMNVPIVEFMVPLCCGKCEEKVKEELENIVGVYKVVCDQHNQRVTISSNLEPQWLLKRVKRIKKGSQFWRGRTLLQSIHIPSDPPVDQSQNSREHLSHARHSEISVYREPNYHKQRSQTSNQNQRHITRSSYDGIQQRDPEKRSVGAVADDCEYYNAGAEHWYNRSSHGSSPYRTSLDAAPGFISAPVLSPLRHGQPSYGQVNQMEDRWPLPSPVCYRYY
ncbi:uncharacterized protein [Physcomitrium patens]|uniref:HMA domain-containing protein n=1 Tax=Physcomitrium patens TaxID=3218 RepID=A0A2K1IZP1_PHYPA|nr:uncharacterized protein LOC112295103 [Physcomitrium patens]PNR34752.1 hypothetical protein PHYPA_022650 [Physcomitrium patens]|eukprot:XP_024402058.1 uncharacterized protein LOC112295103 [Physcomitrella patens]